MAYWAFLSLPRVLEKRKILITYYIGAGPLAMLLPGHLSSLGFVRTADLVSHILSCKLSEHTVFVVGFFFLRHFYI